MTMYTFHEPKDEDKLQAQINSIIDVIPDNVMLVKEYNDKIFSINEKFVDTFGYSRKELIGKTTRELKLWFHEEEREIFLPCILKSGRYKNFEAILVAKDGAQIPIRISSQRILIEREAIIVTVCHNISVMKRTEHSMRDLYLNIFEKSTDGIFILDLETMRFIEFNVVVYTRLGYTREEFAEMTLFDIFEKFTPEWFAQCITDMQENGPVMLKLRDREKTGELRDVLVSFRLQLVNGRLMCHVVVKDIADHKISQEKLAKTQKLTSLGTKTGAIAHDFNNILTGLQGYLFLIRTLHNSDAEISARVTQSESAIQQAFGLTRKLLTLSPEGNPVKK